MKNKKKEKGTSIQKKITLNLHKKIGDGIITTLEAAMLGLFISFTFVGKTKPKSLATPGSVESEN